MRSASNLNRPCPVIDVSLLITWHGLHFNLWLPRQVFINCDDIGAQKSPKQQGATAAHICLSSFAPQNALGKYEWIQPSPHWLIVCRRRFQPPSHYPLPFPLPLTTFQFNSQQDMHISITDPTLSLGLFEPPLCDIYMNANASLWVHIPALIVKSTRYSQFIM